MQFVNLNVTELDAYKESALGLVGDARESLTELTELLDGTASARIPAEVEQAARRLAREVDRIIEIQNAPTLSQAEAIGIVNAAAGDNHVVVNAAGSCPATCTGCGGPATRRPTTWSTATPAWATRSAARSAPRWPTRLATSSASSATEPSCCPARRS